MGNKCCSAENLEESSMPPLPKQKVKGPKRLISRPSSPSLNQTSGAFILKFKKYDFRRGSIKDLSAQRNSDQKLTFDLKFRDTLYAIDSHKIDF